jgi:hypothetical protein
MPASPAPRRWLTALIIAGGLALTLTAIGAHNHRPVATAPHPTTTVAAVPPSPSPVTTTPAPRPRVELVFALDTTGSMSGLIEGAKRKIWSLASFVARGQPTPELRVGLVGYRDIGDDYVTKVYDLDDDLDRVYKRLQKFHAGGGGDMPEHVARALGEAVNKMSWTDRQEVVKVIYVVGDAPPHTDYQDGFDVATAARRANRLGIAVHTIRCGDDPATEDSFRRIAALAHGEFLTIRQDGGMRDATTPYDAELGRLHDQLTDTAMGYGAATATVAATTAAAAAAPAETKAERAMFMAKRGRAIAGAGDLLDDVSDGKVKLDEVPTAALPSSLRSVPLAMRPAKLAEVKKSRAKIIDEISRVSRERDEYLVRQPAAEGASESFDAAAKGALRKSVSGNARSGFKL